MRVPVFSFPAVPSHLFSFWKKIHPHPRYGFILGSGAATPNDHLVYLSLEEPRQIHTIQHEAQLKNFEAKLASSRLHRGADQPRFVGLFSFEAAQLFEPALHNLPAKGKNLLTSRAQFADYAAVLKIDFLAATTTLMWDERVSLKQRKQLIQRVEQALSDSYDPSLKETFSGDLSPTVHQKEFSEKIKKAKDYIRAGDIYQANLSLRLRGPWKGSPLDLYESLCLINPSPYACLLKMKSDWLVSCSPELLLEINKGIIRTRPIAGTRPLSFQKKIDRKRRGQLLLSPKERAEHIMLVDLERNDLGRVCVPGSVHVSEQSAIETYSHVMHIVSEVKGKLQKKATAMEALKALFPGGTITGCPKIRSIQIIHELESLSRGPFYGSAGYFSSDGNAIFNILIRSAYIQKNKIYAQAGAGIVADSHPLREYREVMAKAQVLRQAVKKT